MAVLFGVLRIQGHAFHARMKRMTLGSLYDTMMGRIVGERSTERSVWNLWTQTTSYYAIALERQSALRISRI